MQITITEAEIGDEAARLVLADRYRDAMSLLEEFTSWSLAQRYAFLRAADTRPVEYVAAGAGVRAVRTPPA